MFQQSVPSLANLFVTVKSSDGNGGPTLWISRIDSKAWAHGARESEPTGQEVSGFAECLGQPPNSSKSIVVISCLPLAFSTQVFKFKCKHFPTKYVVATEGSSPSRLQMIFQCSMVLLKQFQLLQPLLSVRTLSETLAQPRVGVRMTKVAPWTAAKWRMLFPRSSR